MADLRRNLGIPSGVVFQFAGTTAPYGYLICDGSAISRADYPDLFLAIGTAHGSGNGSTTFNLPDYRGRFIRGYDGSAGVDPDKASRTAMASGGNTGNAIGSVQGDAMQGHYHRFYGTNYKYGAASALSGDGIDSAYGSANTLSVGGEARDLKTDGTNGTPRTSSESRPKNATANFIIKI